MTDHTHIADDILCLAHTNSMREWCDRRELARLRAKYNSTLPAGKRVVWGWA